MNNSLFVIGQIIRKEFYQIRQDRRMLGVSIAAPIVQVILLGYAATTDIRNTAMVVCDMDKTAESRQLVEEFTNSKYFVHAYDVDLPRDVDYYVDQAKARVGLIIAKGFSVKQLRHEAAHVQVVLDGADANTATILLGYSSQIMSSYAQNIVLARPAVQRTLRSARIIPEPRVWFNPDLTSTNFMVPGVVALVLMIITMTLTSLGIVKEKEIGTLEQLMVTPVKPHELILGKLIPFIIIGFVDVSIVLTIARFWFNVPMAGNIVLLYFLSGLFILTTLGLGLFISTIARSQQQAMLIAQFFFFMPFMFLSGFTFQIANMPKLIQYVTYLIPLRYFLEIVRGIFLKGASLNELWSQTVALAVFGVVILSLSVARFQKKLE